MDEGKGAGTVRDSDWTADDASSEAPKDVEAPAPERAAELEASPARESATPADVPLALEADIELLDEDEAADDEETVVEAALGADPALASDTTLLGDAKLDVDTTLVTDAKLDVDATLVTDAKLDGETKLGDDDLLDADAIIDLDAMLESATTLAAGTMIETGASPSLEGTPEAPTVDEDETPLFAAPIVENATPRDTPTLPELPTAPAAVAAAESAPEVKAEVFADDEQTRVMSRPLPLLPGMLPPPVAPEARAAGGSSPPPRARHSSAPLPPPSRVAKADAPSMRLPSTPPVPSRSVLPPLPPPSTPPPATQSALPALPKRVPAPPLLSRTGAAIPAPLSRTGTSIVPPALSKTGSHLPPPLARTRPSLPPPLARTTTSSAPSLTMSGTIPPTSGLLRAPIAKVQGALRNKQFLAASALGAGVVALLVVGYLGRPQGAETASATSKQEVGAVDTTANAATATQDNANAAAEAKGPATKETTAAAANGREIVPEQGASPAIAAAPGQEGTAQAVAAVDTNKRLARFDVKTPGAVLALISADERRELGDCSQPFDIDTSKSWTLEATKPGYKTVTMPLTFDDETTKTFVVSLGDPEKVEAAEKPAIALDDEHPAKPSTASSKVAANDTAKTTANTKPAADTTKVAVNEPPKSAANAKAAAADAPKVAANEPPKVAANDTAPAAKTEAPKAAAAPAGKCTLNLNSIPASRIGLDGHDIGMTPKIGLTVEPGTHIVMFTSTGAKKVTSATCKAGEQKTVAMRLLL